MNLLKYKLLKRYLKINKFFHKFTVEKIIYCLQKFAWIFLIILVGIILGSLLFGMGEKIIPLIAAVGILISALLASYSVILNINKNVEAKNREHSNLVRDTFFKLCLVKMRLVTLINEKDREKVTYLDIDRIFDTVEDIGNLLQSIRIQDIVAIAHNKVLTEIHFIYLEILTLQTNLKALKKNLIKPDLSKANDSCFINPLKIDMRLEIAIERLSNVLLYLKNGYKNDFPNEKGIEDCAEYKKQMNKT